MLLHVKRPRVQGKSPPEKIVVTGGESGGHEPPDGENSNLHENGGDGERLSTVGEESVEEDEDDAGGYTQEPRPESHDRE